MIQSEKNKTLPYNKTIVSLGVEEGQRNKQIEELIKQNPGIKDAVLAQLKDPRSEYGEYIAVAFLVPCINVDKEILLKDVESFCRENLYEYEVPDQFEFIDKIPYVNSGVVDHKKLEEIANRIIL